MGSVMHRKSNLQWHMCITDREVEMESDTERWKLTRVECSDTVEQWMIPGGSNDKRLTDASSIRTPSFMPTSISLLSLLSPSMYSYHG